MPTAARVKFAQPSSCRSRVATAIGIAAAVAALLCLAQLSSQHTDLRPAAKPASAGAR